MRFQATDDLLIRGVSAARDGDREQARYWLEWALNDYPTTEQQATAAYWLSRATDDLTEQRRYLEQALSADPTHPEARRDLALLDGRLTAEEMIDPNTPISPLTLARPVDANQTITCPRCGGAMRHAVGQPTLTCQFCGTRAPDEPAPSPAEQDWFAAAHSVRGHRWVLAERLSVVCANCGATRALPPGQTGGACPYCASPRLTQLEKQHDLMAPDGVVPFAINEAAARARVQQWRERQRRSVGVSGPAPIYLPFWTFDVDAAITWQATRQDGFFLLPTRGSDRLFFDDLLVPATHSLPVEALQALRFDTSAIIPYTDDLLAGWPAEIYHVPMMEASLTARSETQALSREHVSALPDADERGIVVTGTSLSVSTYKLLLAPVWVAIIKADSETRPLVINGQTGQLHATDRPRPMARLLNWLTSALAR